MLLQSSQRKDVRQFFIIYNFQFSAQVQGSIYIVFIFVWQKQIASLYCEQVQPEILAKSTWPSRLSRSLLVLLFYLIESYVV